MHIAYNQTSYLVPARRENGVEGRIWPPGLESTLYDGFQSFGHFPDKKYEAKAKYSNNFLDKEDGKNLNIFDTESTEIQKYPRKQMIWKLF